MILDIAAASVATGVPARTIRRWVTDGKVTRPRRGHVILAEVEREARRRQLPYPLRG